MLDTIPVTYDGAFTHNVLMILSKAEGYVEVSIVW